jgi:rRNA-processing protein FCF1
VPRNASSTRRSNVVARQRQLQQLGEAARKHHRGIVTNAEPLHLVKTECERSRAAGASAVSVEVVRKHHCCVITNAKPLHLAKNRM